MILIGLLLGLLLWKNNLYSRLNGYKLYGDFKSVNGLLLNSVVKYRGYPIGRVTDIAPNPQKIEVEFFVQAEVSIPIGSTVKVVFDGLVGEKYLEIIPNIHSDIAYEPEGRLVGYATSGLSDFIDVGTQNLLELRAVLETMTDIFGDKEISYAIKDVVLSMQDTAKNIDKIVDELSNVSGSEEVVNILKNTDQLMHVLSDTITRNDLNKLKTTIENLETFSVNLNEFFSDETFKESLLNTLNESKVTFERSNTFLETVSNIKFKPDVDFSYNSHISGIVYQLNAKFWLDEAFLKFGFGNYFEADKLIDVQIGNTLSQTVMLRYGLIKATGGVGIDYKSQLFPFIITFNAYDFDNINFDVLLEQYILKNISLHIGYNEFNQSTRNWVVGLSVVPK